MNKYIIYKYHIYRHTNTHTHTYTHAGTIRGGAALVLQQEATAASPVGYKKFSQISDKMIVYSKCNSDKTFEKFSQISDKVTVYCKCDSEQTFEKFYLHRGSFCRAGGLAS